MEKRETVNILRTKIEGPKKDKNNKDFYSVGIQTKEYGDKWFNCHYFPFNPDKWEGTEQSLIFYEEDYQGKTYSKFKLPPRPFNGGMSEADKAQLVQAVRTANAAHEAVKILRSELNFLGILKQTTSDGSPIPDFSQGSGSHSFSGPTNDSSDTADNKAPGKETPPPEDESLMRSAEAAWK